MRRHFVFRAGIVFVVAIVMAGCGGNDGEFVTSRRSLPVAASPAPNVPSLKSQLLKISDLPIGWATDNDDVDTDVEGSDCLKNAKKLFNPPAKETADFKKGSFTSISETVAYFPQPELATSTLNTVFEAFVACKTFWFKSEGRKFTGDLNELSFPTVGEQSRALTSEIDIAGFTLGLNEILLRKDNVVVTIIYIDLGTPDIEEFQDLVNRAYSKLA